METVLKKWGNSAAVRIPAAILEAAHLTLDQSVDVREEQGPRIDRRVDRRAWEDSGADWRLKRAPSRQRRLFRVTK
jgi:antitoxin component of MazEF toxin-antitoxin module